MKLDFLQLASSFGELHEKRAVGAQSYATTSDAKRLISPGQPPVQGYYYGSCSGTIGCWNFTTNDQASGYKQAIDGFGAAITDATVFTLASLPQAQAANAIRDLFGPATGTTPGNQFNLMRHTIGSSDLTADGFNYTYDDSKTPDPALSKFSTTPLGSAMLAFMYKIKNAYPAIKYIGSSWSAPGWMKLNGAQTGSTVNNNLNANFSQQFANYFVKYIQTFAANGVNIDAITIQNEPLNSRNGMPTMYIDPYQATDLVGKFVGPAFKASGLGTQIWAYDHNTDQPSYPQTVVNGAGSYVGAVAWHCYAENNDWSVLSNFHSSNPNTVQYMTECWTSPTNDWYSTADFTIGPLQNWAQGVLAWNLASDAKYGPHLSSPDACQTCRGLIVTNSDGTYSKTLDYYLMGQFSRFVQRGSIVLSGTGSYDYGNGAKFESISFINADKSRTVVIESTFGNDVYATMSFASGETWTGLVLAKSVTTWVLPPTTGKNPAPAPVGASNANIAPSTTSNGATFLNCFPDDPQYHSLSNMVGSVSTVDQCTISCQNAGYSLAGVEGTTCYCDNYISVSPIDKSNCATKCTGNANQTCGGKNAMQVYNVPSKPSRPMMSTAKPITSSTMTTTTSSAKAGRPTIATASN